MSRRKKNHISLISPTNTVKFDIEKDTFKDSLNCKLKKVSGQGADILYKKNPWNFNAKYLQKKKTWNGGRQLDNCKRITTRFQKYNQLILIEVKIEDDTINTLNTLNKYKSAIFQFVPVGLLFSSGIKNTTNQIFIIVNGLNNPKISLINEKILNILTVIYLQQMKKWDSFNGSPYWVNVVFEKLKNTKKIDYFRFSFRTKSLNHLLSFSSLFWIYRINLLNLLKTKRRKVFQNISKFQNWSFVINNRSKTKEYTRARRGIGRTRERP